jgi:hypothetical protein
MERAGQLLLNGVGRHRIAAAALALLILGRWPRDLHAQAFIASHPHPEFGIGPLFVSVSVGKDDVRPAHRPVALTVSWSLVPPPNRRAADIAQDLFLLWPGEVAGTVGADGADPALVRHVRALGFQVKEHGRLRLSARARSQIGTSAEVRTLGEAPFVTFVTDGGSARPASGATYIRIPWAPESVSLDWLVRLEMPVRDVIVPKPVSWIEDMFWGRWYTITLGFGDLGSVALYPLYFGVRDRVIPLARDFSMLVIEFADAQHLRVDELVPPSASRRTSERRDNGEMISLALAASQGLVPQLVKVHFTYAPRRVPARPLLISAFLVVLGSIMRRLSTPVMSWIGRTLRAHVLLSRAPDAGRYRGMTPPPQVLDRIRPGETTYEDVLRLCGPGVEEQVRLPARETQALVYRGQRVVPHRWWSLGWFATVRYWDVEDHEVEITFERNRVRDIKARVRRLRLSDPPPG